MNFPGVQAQAISHNANNRVPDQRACTSGGDGFGNMLETVMTRPEPQHRSANAEPAHTASASPHNASKPSSSDPKSSGHKAKSAQGAHSAQASGFASAQTEQNRETGPGVVAVDSRSDESDSDCDDSEKNRDSWHDPVESISLTSINDPIAALLPVQQRPIPAPETSAGEGDGLSKEKSLGTESGTLAMSALPSALQAISLSARSLTSASMAGLPIPNAASQTQADLAGLEPVKPQVSPETLPDVLANVPPTGAAQKDPQANPAKAETSETTVGQIAEVLGSTARETSGSAKAVVSDAGLGEAIRIVSRSNTTGAELKNLAGDKNGDSRNSAPVGTGVAPHERQMLREEQQNEFADRAKQYLPDKAESLSPRAQAADLGPRRQDSQAKLSVESFSAVSAKDVSSSTSVDAESVAKTTEPSPILNRLISGVNHEAMILRQFKPDKLDVVLRPDAATQISLQLRLDGDGIQGVARCEKGDFNLLASHWTELQRTMHQQGVHLEPLKESASALSLSTGTSFGGSSDMARDRRARRLESVISMTEPSTGRAIESSPAVASRNPSTGRHLLQTWA